MRNTPLNLRYKSIQKRFMFGLTCIVFLYIIVDQQRVYIISFCQILYIYISIIYLSSVHRFLSVVGGSIIKLKQLNPVSVILNNIKGQLQQHFTIYHTNTQVATRGKQYMYSLFCLLRKNAKKSICCPICCPNHIIILINKLK